MLNVISDSCFRYMFKFQFMRMVPPCAPSWNSNSPEFPIKEPAHLLSPVHFHKIMEEKELFSFYLNLILLRFLNIQIWKWLQGGKVAMTHKDSSSATSGSSDLQNHKNLFRFLKDHSAQGETMRLHAAYSLAHEPASPLFTALMELVYSDVQCIRRFVS